jgi:predicted HTH transcriptional regulator
LDELVRQEENEILEFKASMRFDHDKKGANKEIPEHEVARTIAGFMNSEGGLLFIGVRPNKIVGLSIDFGTIKNGNYDKWYQRLSEVIHVEYEIDSFFKSYYNVTKLGDSDNPVAVVRVGKSPRPVWLRDKDKNGINKYRFYIRRNNQTTQLHNKDLHEYIISHFH